jgi:hypothetical protein
MPVVYLDLFQLYKQLIRVYKFYFETKIDQSILTKGRNMFAMIIGAASAGLIMKFKPEFFVRATLAMLTLYFCVEYFEIYSLLIVMNYGPEFAIGAVAAFFAARLHTVLVQPLVKGKWPEFKNYYVARGIVVDSRTVTHNQSVGTVSKGVFGNDVINVNHYSTDYDTLSIQLTDGSVTQITGVNLKNHTKPGHEIVFGGAVGHSFYSLLNMTTNEVYSDRAAGKIEASIMGVVSGIPGLGAFMNAIFFVFGSKYLRRVVRLKACYSTNHMEYERSHIRLQFLYLTVFPLLAWAMCMYGVLSQGKALGLALIVPLVLSVIHVQLWRKDYERFRSFLVSQLRNKAGETA